MKKAFLFLCLLALLPGADLYAKVPRIIELKGKVFLKAKPQAAWEETAVGAVLGRRAEIRTKAGSECVIIFDEAGKNVLALKEKSHLKIEDARRGKVVLNEGKLFSLIDHLKTFKKSKRPFEVRTPSAIVGVRGTGWSTEVQPEATQAACFEGEVAVAGLDQQGKEGETQDLASGFGREVTSQGQVGGSFELSSEALAEWGDFRTVVEGLGKLIGGVTKAVGGVTEGALDGYLGPQKDNPFGR